MNIPASSTEGFNVNVRAFFIFRYNIGTTNITVFVFGRNVNSWSQLRIIELLRNKMFAVYLKIARSKTILIFMTL